MQVFFAGTRGAYPTFRPANQKTGGNTNCVTVSVGEDRLIIDGGTGTENISPATATTRYSCHIFISTT